MHPLDNLWFPKIVPDRIWSSFKKIGRAPHPCTIRILTWFLYYLSKIDDFLRFMATFRKCVKTQGFWHIKREMPMFS